MALSEDLVTIFRTKWGLSGFVSTGEYKFPSGNAFDIIYNNKGEGATYLKEMFLNSFRYVGEPLLPNITVEVDKYTEEKTSKMMFYVPCDPTKFRSGGKYRLSFLDSPTKFEVSFVSKTRVKGDSVFALWGTESDKVEFENAMKKHNLFLLFDGDVCILEMNTELIKIIKPMEDNPNEN